MFAIKLHMPTTVVQAIELDYELCDCCGICVDFCPVGVFMSENGAPKVCKLSACYACDTCVDLCPKAAISLIDKTASGPDFGADRSGRKNR